MKRFLPTWLIALAVIAFVATSSDSVCYASPQQGEQKIDLKHAGHEPSSQKTDSVEPRPKLTELVEEFEQAKELWMKEKKAAKTKEEKKAARAHDPTKTYGAKFLEFAKTSERTEDYVPALERAMSHGGTNSQFASTRLLVDILIQAKNDDQVEQAREVLGSDSTKKFLVSFMLPAAEREALAKDLIRVSEGNTKGLALNALTDIYKRKKSMASAAARMSGGKTAEEKKRRLPQNLRSWKPCWGIIFAKAKRLNPASLQR